MKRAIIYNKKAQKDLQKFPSFVREKASMELDRVAEALPPVNWKPMKTVGDGVREIRVSYRGQWRVFYVVMTKDKVFHAFNKKGQKTSKEDIELGRARFKQLKEGLYNG